MDRIVPELTAQRRAICRQAIGPELIGDARILSQLSLADLPQPGLLPRIPLPPALTRNDLHRGWIDDLLAPLQEALRAFGGFAFDDDGQVGRRLRGSTRDLIDRAREVAELGSFLSEFGPDPVARAYALLTIGLWHQAVLDVLIVVADDDALAAARADRHRQASEHERVAREQLDALVAQPIQPIGSPDELMTVVLGEPPSRPLRGTYDFMHAFGRDPTHLFDLGMRQLRLLVTFPEIPLEFATGFISSALKIGSSTLPLYSHRVADGVAHLIAQAAERDGEATNRLLMDFNSSQAGRIQAAGNSYGELLAQAQAGGDEFAFPDAYRTMTEGMLRPYGSLLVRLAELADGLPPTQFALFPTLGDLETAMAVFARRRSPIQELPQLLALGLDRPMRNYEAHENIVRSGTGVLAVIAADGSLEPLDLDQLHEHMITLMSFLVGVDVAQNVALIPVTRGQAFPTNVIHTEAFVAAVAAIAVAETTDAVVTECVVREGTMTIEIDGIATPAQLGLLRGPLGRLLDPAVETVEFVRVGSGSLIFRVDLGTAEERAALPEDAAIENVQAADQGGGTSRPPRLAESAATS